MHMASFDDFCNYLKAEMEVIFPDCKIGFQEIVKGNDIHLRGMSITPKDTHFGLLHYLNAPYDAFCKGEVEIDKIINSLKETQREMSAHYSKTLTVPSWEEVKSLVSFKVLDELLNEDYLKDKVYFPLVGGFVKVPIIDFGNSTVTITKELVSELKISFEELKELLREDTKNIYVSRLVDDISKGRYNCFENDKFDNDVYVVSNEENYEGASRFFTKGTADKIYEKFGMNYYMIPVSIDEVLVVPITDKFHGIEEAEKMLKESNDKIQTPDKILSYTILIYTKEEGLTA